MAVATEAVEGEGRPRSASSVSAIRKLALSRGITYAGGNAAFWALSAVLYEQTDSPALVAAAALASFSVPAALSPLAGALGDHRDRRKVLLGSELAGAICFLAMAAASGSPAALLGLRVLASVASAPFVPATKAILPSLVPDDDLDNANSTIEKAGITGCLVGAAVAALTLVTIGGAFVFLLNTITFLISAAIIFSIRGDFKPRVMERGNLAAGFAYLRGHPILRRLTTAYALTFIGIGVSIPAEIVLAEEFGAGSLGYAALFCLWGAGGIVGATAGSRLKRGPRRFVIGGAALVLGAGLLAVSVAPVFAVALLGMAVGGAGEGVWEVTQTSLAQRVTPDGVRGRVFAGIEAVMQSGLAVGLLISGLVTAVAGATGAFAVAGAAASVAALTLLLRDFPAETALEGKASELARSREGRSAQGFSVSREVIPTS